jgi:hypothetical protein
MILSALFSFLGGSAFRMIWGEIAAWLNKKQDHAYELERLRAEGEMEAARHARDMERVRLQSDLKVQEVKVVADAAISQFDAQAFVEAQKRAFAPIGVKWVDAWNGSIRPAMATIALLLWVFALAKAGFVTGDWDRELIAGILGFYIADRTLAKRGK